jgi:Ricin-type beta-trefoil lectin domain-like
MVKLYLRIILLFCSSLSFIPAFSQQPFTVTQSAPARLDGLKAGYTLVNEKEKEVGDKGNFSRFSIEFYITNETNQAKIILYKQGFNLLASDVSPNLVLFRCINATGARMTSKEFSLQAKTCMIPALVEDKDCSSGKTTQSKRQVQVGYWIKAGETISTKSVVIVPLSQQPDMTAVFFPNSNSPVGSTINNQPVTNDLPVTGGEGFMKIRNFAINTFLNNQDGPLGCTTIDNGWWSAQWQLLPVPGTNYYVIKNRWKNNFISTGNNGLLSVNDQSANSMWMIEAVGNSNTYTLKNVGTNRFLINQDGALQAEAVFADQPNARWILEQ